MPAVTLSTEVTGETQGDSKIWSLKAWVSETSGFTDDPGADILLAFTGPDSVDYHYRAALPSDMYNYPTDSSDGTFPYFRRSWLHRKFTNLYEASEFKDDLETHLAGFASDWEDLQTDTATTEDQTFEGGTLHVSRKTTTSTTAQHEDDTYAEYRLATLTATVTDAADSSVFILSDDDSSLDRIATYDDMDTLPESDRESSITICVDSEAKETEILDAIKADLANLASELDLMS